MHWVIADLVAKYLVEPRYEFPKWIDKAEHNKLAKYLFHNPRAYKYIKWYSNNQISHKLSRDRVRYLCSNPNPKVIELIKKFDCIKLIIDYPKYWNIIWILRGLLINK